MATQVKINNQEEALLNKVLENLRSGKYEIEVQGDVNYRDENRIQLGEKISIYNIYVGSKSERTRRIICEIAGHQFSGKFVRRLSKTLENILAPKETKARGGKRKEAKSEEELSALLDLI